jgi:excisionase family DNA binding protein
VTAPALVTITAEELRAIVREEVRAAIGAREARDESELLTPREAADILGVTTRTLRDYSARGLRVVRVSPRVVRYRRADLDAFAHGRGNGRE